MPLELHHEEPRALRDAGSVRGEPSSALNVRPSPDVEADVVQRDEPFSASSLKDFHVSSRDIVRSRRAREIRAKTESARRITKRDLYAGELLYPPVEGVERPKTRGDCLPGGSNAERPCPFVSCSYHLYLDEARTEGSIRYAFPDLEPDALEQTCALDVADLGGAPLEDVGVFTNVTRERIRQIEKRALRQLGKRRGGRLRELVDVGTASRGPRVSSGGSVRASTSRGPHLVAVPEDAVEAEAEEEFRRAGSFFDLPNAELEELSPAERRSASPCLAHLFAVYTRADRPIEVNPRVDMARLEAGAEQIARDRAARADQPAPPPPASRPRLRVVPEPRPLVVDETPPSSPPISPRLPETRMNTQDAVLQQIKANPGVTVPAIAAAVGITAGNAGYNARRLIELGQVRTEGLRPLKHFAVAAGKAPAARATAVAPAPPAQKTRGAAKPAADGGEINVEELIEQQLAFHELQIEHLEPKLESHRREASRLRAALEALKGAA